MIVLFIPILQEVVDWLVKKVVSKHW